MQIALHLKTPDAALLMQLTDRAGAMMALKRRKSLTLPPIRSVPARINSTAACPGPHRSDRFDNYWNKDAYHFDKIIYLPIPDASVRLATCARAILT
jgi:peptide/nickel transport system substrate-binding protein